VALFNRVIAGGGDLEDVKQALSLLSLALRRAGVRESGWPRLHSQSGLNVCLTYINTGTLEGRPHGASPAPRSLPPWAKSSKQKPSLVEVPFLSSGKLLLS
jgi:hypothetical protein